MKLRKYKATDCEDCRNLILNCLPDIGGISAAALRNLLSKAKDHNFSKELEKSYCLVLEENDSLIGMGILEDCELKRMYIDSKFRGRNFGKQLLESLERKAEELKIEELYLESSESAKGFYIHFGYEPLGKYSYEIAGEEISGLRMKKKVFVS